MDEIKKMLDETENVITYWIEINRYKSHGKIPVIVEGKDFIYYKHHLTSDASLNLEADDLGSVNMCGRDNLIELVEYFDSKNESKKNMLFFLDHEYPSRTYTHPDIFVTDRHSIENYYVDKTVFKKFLDKYTVLDEEYKNVLLSLFTINQTIFQKNISKMGMILNFGLEKGLTTKIKKIKFSDFFIFENFILKTKNTIVPELLFDELTFKNNKSALEQVEKQSLSSECSMFYIRGKDELSFFCEFIKQILHLEGKGTTRDSKADLLKFIDPSVHLNRASQEYIKSITGDKKMKHTIGNALSVENMITMLVVISSAPKKLAEYVKAQLT